MKISVMIMMFLLVNMIVEGEITDKTDDVAFRSQYAIDDYYRTYKDSKELNNLDIGVVINWSICCFVIDKDIDQANKVLGELFRGKEHYFTQPAARVPLYWELTKLVRMCTDLNISDKVAYNNKQLIKAILYDFSKEIYIDDLADTSPEKVLRVYKSENHDMIHKGLNLLAAQVLKNDSKWRDIKYSDGRTPAEHYGSWKLHLMESFRQKAMQGLTSEFACPVYAGAYLQPIFLIYDCCEDKILREQAGKFLTLFFTDAAQETLNGIRGGARTRVYRKRGYPYIAKADRFSNFLHVLTRKPSENRHL